MANGEGHKIQTQAALEVLPVWEKDILATVKDMLENEYCMYGDDYFGNQSEIGPFIELPDGRLPMDPWEIRHFRKDGPGKDYYICGYYDLMRYSFEYFSGKCIESLRNGNISDFAKFAGSIAHVIEDCGAPPHAVGTTIGTDMKLMKLLHPSGDKVKMAKQFHTILEGKYEPYKLDYRPQLLGTSAEEISFNLFERFTDMIETSISQIIPMLDAFYRDDWKLLSEHLSLCGAFSSEVLADFMHSVMCIGYSRFENEETDSLKNVFLSEHTPEINTAWMPPPYHYAELRKSPWSLNRDFEPFGLALSMNGKEMSFEKGYGLGPPCEINFILPKGVYGKFSTTVGINSRLGAKTGIKFGVCGDGKEIAGINCKGIPDSGILEVPMEGVRRLTLRTIPYDSKTPYPDNTHAVWGNPILSKR